MTSSFRTAGAWGGGLGRPLTWVEQDNNIYDKETRITAIETAGVAVGIDHITVSGDQMTIYMTDSSIQGPFTLPSADMWNPVGAWQPSTLYHAGDTVYSGGSLYLVLADHTSDSTFDPGAMEGTVPRYHLIIPFSPIEGFNRSGATFTPALEDGNTYNRLTHADGCAVTIDGSVDFADWTEIHFRDCSTGTDSFCTIAGSSGATLNLPRGYEAASAGEGATWGMKKVGATNAWDVWGLLQASSA
jgi:hypothetical protein